ncbi:hypothetical protein ISCGN_023218 [Ixodes scapularis]
MAAPLPFLRLSEIHPYFKDEDVAFEKGERKYLEGYVLSFDAEEFTLRAHVQASFKNCSYLVRLSLSHGGDILACQCECPRGAAKCSHMVATALYAALNGFSKTDLPQQWLRRPKSSAPWQVALSEAHFPGSATDYRATGRAVSEEDVEVLCSALATCPTKWVVQRSSALQPPSPAEKFSVASVLASGADFSVTTDNQGTIHEMTVGQRTNPSWSLLRKYRLTASNFGRVLDSCRRSSYPPSLFKTLFGEYNLSTNCAVIWGQVHEEEALLKYEQQKGLTTTKSGLWLHESGVLGGSPDGLIGTDGLVEVKCPWTWRDHMIKEAFGAKDFCLDTTGSLITSHPYYHQIQGCLTITRRRFCDLALWTNKDLHVLRVEADAMWGQEKLPQLLNFYYNRMLPLVNDRPTKPFSAR